MQFWSARAARGWWLVFAVAISVSACSNNLSGRLAALGTGDVSAPAVARIAPGDGAGTCASVSGADPPAKRLARAPYLQRVTATDAVVVWTATEGASASVLVETPGGDQLGSFTAALDSGGPEPVVSAKWAYTPPPGLTNRPRQWRAGVTGLAPDTTYCYTVLQDGVPASAPSAMKTAPPTGSKQRVQFVAFGDSGGGGDDQRRLLQQVETVPFDFMIHTGDIAYDNGTLSDFETKFFAVYAPLLAARPMFPASGNHDYETADAAPFREVFVLPENGGPDGLERWYSYDWGDVHLVALDTERTGPVQAAWLEADLAANRLPWTVVYAHKPPRSSGEHGDDPDVNRWFVPILKTHHVQLVLAGHDHHYERFRPIDGITYFVTGGGGRGVRLLGAREATSAYAEPVIHFLVVTVDPDAMTVHAIDGTGREFDSTVIRRDG